MALQTKTFNTQAEAKTWATMIEREMDAGVFVSRNEAESTSFANALEMYAEQVTSKSAAATPSCLALRSCYVTR
ncbi:hypothetical protein ACP3P8_24185 [Pseudomonas aeruginosa]